MRPITPLCARTYTIWCCRLARKVRSFDPINFKRLGKWQPIQLCSLQICDGKVHQCWKHLQGSHWSFHFLCPHSKIQTARSTISGFPYLQSKMGCRVWNIQASSTVFLFVSVVGLILITKDSTTIEIRRQSLWVFFMAFMVVVAMASNLVGWIFVIDLTILIFFLTL